jgi:hypothetical protein
MDREKWELEKEDWVLLENVRNDALVFINEHYDDIKIYIFDGSCIEFEGIDKISFTSGEFEAILKDTERFEKTKENK